MNYIYCQSCFKKTPQTTDLVRFCSHCGKPFIDISTANVSNANVETKPQKAPKTSQTLTSEDTNEDIDDIMDDIDFDDNIRVPKLKNLKVEVELDQCAPQPIASIARNAPREPKAKNKNAVKMNKKKAWEQFQKEASSLRPKK